MLHPEAVSQPHSSADQNREAGDGDCCLGVELEESFKHGCCDATSPDSSDGTECHDEAEDKDPHPLDCLHREDWLVVTYEVIALKVRVIVALLAPNACNLLFAQKWPCWGQSLVNRASFLTGSAAYDKRA